MIYESIELSDIIISNLIVLSSIALLSAVVLYLAAKKFKTENNPLIDEIADLLPQANCGACGKAGCRDFANSCACADAESFTHLYCPVGGTKVMNTIATRLGYSSPEHDPTVAVLHCNGTCENAPDKVEYIGLQSCRLANRAFVGKTGCPNGCLRLGDCVRNCPFGAIEMDSQTGLPVVNPDKCTSCGACIRICPRGLYEIRSRGKDGIMVYVACSNKQKGAIARKNCKAACIACMKCSKICPEIKIENNLSNIPACISAATYGAELANVCPTGAIIYTGANDDQN